MSASDSFPAVMSALALGDVVTAKRLSVTFTADDHEGLYIFGTAVMALCLEDRFKDDAGPEAIRQFVDEMRYDFRNSEPSIKPLMIEAYIRAFAGEEHLLAEVPESERMDAQIPIIRKIVAQSPHLRNEIDRLMNDAGDLASQWQEADV